MSITLQQFEKYINSMVEMQDLSHALERLLKAESFLTFDHVYTGNILELLEIIFNDECGWISHWIYELNYGIEAERLPCTEDDGTVIPMKTVADLYTRLIWEMENE